jgi:hypothetical protein
MMTVRVKELAQGAMENRSGKPKSKSIIKWVLQCNILSTSDRNISSDMQSPHMSTLKFFNILIIKCQRRMSWGKPGEH